MCALQAGFVGRLLALGIALSGPALVSAQGYDLEPGSRIRVSIYRSPSPHPVSQTEGLLLKQSADSLYLAVGDNADTTAVSLGPGMKIEAVSGRRGQAWLGVAIGSLVGLVAGMAVVREEPDCTGDMCGLGAAVGGSVGLVVGGFVGGIVGSQIKKDRWTVVPRVGPLPGGLTGVGATIRF